jgi:hypothetical protein
VTREVMVGRGPHLTEVENLGLTGQNGFGGVLSYPLGRDHTLQFLLFGGVSFDNWMPVTKKW